MANVVPAGTSSAGTDSHSPLSDSGLPTAADPSGQEAKRWRSRFWLSVSAKNALVAEWVVLDRYFLGKQWDNRRASWRPDPVTNYIYEVIDEHVAQIVQSPITPILTAQKPSDTQAAELFGDVVKWWTQRHRLTALLDEGAETAFLLGTGVAKIYWDPDAEGGANEPEYIPGPADSQADQAGAQQQPGNPQQFPGSLWKGDVGIQMVDPANFYLDPGAYDLQSAAWCGTMVPKPIEYAQARWPNHPIRPEYSFNLSEVYYRPSAFQAFQATQGDSGGGYVNVFEGWEKSTAPCQCGAHKRYPKDDPRYMPPDHTEGLVRVIMVNNIVVERQPHFYKHGLYPFARLRDIRVRKSFWGQGQASQILSLQKLVNKLMELIAVNAMLTANQQKVLMAQAGIDPKTITNEPGKVYVSSVQNPIEPVTASAMPQYVFQLLGMAKGDIQQVAGMFTAPPAGVRAAAAIIALLEKMASRLKRKGNNVAEFVREITVQMIKLYQEFGTETRLARVSDAFGGVKFFAFRGVDYANSECDVDVEAGTGQTLSRAIIAEQADKALAMKDPAGNPAIRPSEYLEAIDFPLKSVIQRLKKLEATYDQQQAQGQQAPGLGTAPGMPTGPTPGAPPGGIPPKLEAQSEATPALPAGLPAGQVSGPTLNMLRQAARGGD